MRILDAWPLYLTAPLDSTLRGGVIEGMVHVSAVHEEPSVERFARPVALVSLCDTAVVVL